MSEQISSILNIDHNSQADCAESFCTNCEGTGETRLLVTKIPFFKQIIIASFSCDECGYKNSSIEFGGKLADRGIKMQLSVTNMQQLSRYIIKSDFTSISIPKLQLEIPASTQKGTVNTVEGFLSKTKEGLIQDQPLRKIQNPEQAQQIQDFCEKIDEYMSGKHFPFDINLDDPSGNCFIQNPNAPNADPFLKFQYYDRSKQMLKEMGYGQTQFNNIPEEESKKIQQDKVVVQKKSDSQEVKQKPDDIIDYSKPLEQADFDKEASLIPSECYSCGQNGFVKMCVSTIPHFKDIIIMAFNCDFCGYKNNEIKHGGGISQKGMKITFNVQNLSDMSRDLFKSESCTLSIPQLQLDLSPGTLGSQYTTVEGLLKKVMSNLGEKNPFVVGDTLKYEENYNNFQKFLMKLEDFINFKQKFTLILDDPLNNCWIYSELAPKPDPQIVSFDFVGIIFDNQMKEEYTRTEQQNDELGITYLMKNPDA